MGRQNNKHQSVYNRVQFNSIANSSLQNDHNVESTPLHNKFIKKLNTSHEGRIYCRTIVSDSISQVLLINWQLTVLVEIHPISYNIKCCSHFIIQLSNYSVYNITLCTLHNEHFVLISVLVYFALKCVWCCSWLHQLP